MSKTKTEKKKCFIITPIGAEDSEIHREALGLVDVILKPLLDSLGYDAFSAIDFNTGQITDLIVNSIYEADLIIANITEQNPNVMYELALAHAFKIPTHHILRKGEKAPFDIGVHKYYEYKNDFRGTEDLRGDLMKAIKSGVPTKEEVSNPVVSSLKHYTAAEPEEVNVSFQDLVDSVFDMRKEMDIFIRTIDKRNKNDINRGLHEFDNEEVRDRKYDDLINLIESGEVEPSFIFESKDPQSIIASLVGANSLRQADELFYRFYNEYSRYT